MKYFISLSFLQFLLFHALLSQSCLPDGISFSSQEEIDAFALNYPTCLIIEGDVVIDDDFKGDIKNLLGLSNVKQIRGRLYLKNNSALPNLNGLNNLEHIESGLRIEENNLLKSLENLELLYYVGQGITIMDNDSLLSLKGLEAISSLSSALTVGRNEQLLNLEGLDNLYLTGGIEIAANMSLQNFNGLNNLEEVEYGALFYANNNMNDFSGLENLKKINGNLWIRSNRELTNLDALSNLDSINGNLRILENQSLTSIDGISNINPETIKSIGSSKDLRIRDNYSLSECSISNICFLFQMEDITTDISNNKEGCNNRDEIESLCLSHTRDIDTQDLEIVPNPASVFLKIIHKQKTGIDVRLYNSLGNLRGEFDQDSIDVSGLEQGIYFIEVWSEGRRVGTKKFIKG